MSRKSKQILGRVCIIILLAVLAVFVNRYQPEEDSIPSHEAIRTDVVELHFIDVGQGDSILVVSGNTAMLIDAGENNQGEVVVDYLRSHNIKELEYVIGTHPHSDHIGGLDTVLSAFPVNHVILPSVTHMTKTFEDLLNVIEEKNMKITKAEVGDEYRLGAAAFTIVAPNASSYEEMNNYSVGIHLTYLDNSFLLTGDAEKLSEREMIKNRIDLSADVLKLSHHGSSTSSSEEFLDAVNPSYAVISVGRANEYGHPDADVLQRLSDRNIKVFRTDEQGTIVFTTDGKNISVNTKDYGTTGLQN
jgi:competence protein ComEC